MTDLTNIRAAVSESGIKARPVLLIVGIHGCDLLGTRQLTVAQARALADDIYTLIGRESLVDVVRARIAAAELTSQQARQLTDTLYDLVGADGLVEAVHDLCDDIEKGGA